MCHFQFFKREELIGERFDSHLISLKELMKQCDFGSKSKPILRSKIVSGINNKSLQERRDDTDLKTTINYSQASEQADESIKTIYMKSTNVLATSTDETPNTPTDEQERKCTRCNF